jgi:hypothetical protein
MEETPNLTSRDHLEWARFSRHLSLTVSFDAM